MSDIPSPFSLSQGLVRDLRLPSFLAAQVDRRLRKIQFGSVSVVLPNGRRLSHAAALPGPAAKLVVRRWRALWRLMLGGDLAFARAYIDGDWWSPDLPTLLEFGARNRAALGAAPVSSGIDRWVNRLRHWARRNTPRGSRRNIAAHYDLGNDFYAQWLDRGMNYSSALFSRDDETLESAQRHKLERIAALLGLSGRQRLLEIGCGWGALAEHLAPRCEVTGVTLSVQQLSYARQRLQDSDLRAELRLQDYRDVTGRYDRIASIEMIEAVGERYWPRYFAKLRELLSSDGVIVLQAITIDDALFDSYRRQPDFIQRYIFPGGMLPSVEAIRREAATAGLQLVSTDSFGPSYARTLAIWRERFRASWPEIHPFGFDIRFKRMWDYYLCYCEAGFRAGVVDVGLFKLTRKPAN